MKTIATIAEENLNTHFVDNPNRGLVLGLDEAGNMMQLYWIMGRSSGSQNRVFLVEPDAYTEGERVKTAAADESIVDGDPKLLIYNAMRSIEGAHVVTNGDQTDTIMVSEPEVPRMDESIIPEDFFAALGMRYCEPDSPIFTPRISGMQRVSEPDKVYLSVLKADPFARNTPEKYDKNSFPTLRNGFERGISPGYGLCLTTYMPGSQELPSFEGEPLIMPVRGDLEEVMDTFWNKLEPQWRVSLVGKMITPSGVTTIADPINAKQEIYETTR